MKAINCIFLVVFFLISCNSEKKDAAERYAKKKIDYTDYAEKAYDYCKQKNLNTDYCFLIDLSVHSGLKRFFKYDFEARKITDSMLVTHGCGDHPWKSTYTKLNPEFSNEDGSHLSSLGKYIIGERGGSIFGVRIKYLLHGMDEGNKNALKRAIVFHSWEKVPNTEVYPEGTPEGWGCPAISNEAFVKLDRDLKTRNQGTLLWMFQSGSNSL